MAVDIGVLCDSLCPTPAGHCRGVAGLATEMRIRGCTVDDMNPA